jgi:hypothetical protein
MQVPPEINGIAGRRAGPETGRAGGALRAAGARVPRGQSLTAGVSEPSTDGLEVDEDGDDEAPCVCPEGFHVGLDAPPEGCGVEPAEVDRFPRPPRDDHEREALAPSTLTRFWAEGRCLVRNDDGVCTMPRQHQGDHVAATRAQVLVRWAPQLGEVRS